MTKNYQIAEYLVSCEKHTWDEVKGYRTKELLNMIKDKKRCAKYLVVPMSYLKYSYISSPKK